MRRTSWDFKLPTNELMISNRQSFGNLTDGMVGLTTGIRANLVAPGAIETDFTKPAFDANPQVKEMIAAQTALGRIGVPDDIGGVVAFLCSEEARWVNGQRLEVSGGIFL